MKLEKPPPIGKIDYIDYFEKNATKEIGAFLKETDKRYDYWTELKRRPNQQFGDAKEVWKLVKAHRSVQSRLLMIGRYKFSYNITTYIEKDLHEFDLKLMGGLNKGSITPQDQQEYFRNTLIEEAIASSQIEGAATTTDIAREMIKKDRIPKNESEQMIFNNFNAIREIQVRLKEDLNKQIILDIHDIMTNKTEAAKYAGSFRSGPIHVTDYVDGEIAHTGPDSKEVDNLISQLLNFINSEDAFIHPIIKASILHFMIGYIHPFGDGNGRTARALFYWYLMKKDYTLMRHISISRAILDSRSSYDKAFLKTENDDNDLTYFIQYSIKSLRIAFQSLINYRDRKQLERNEQNELKIELLKRGFTERTSDLMAYIYMKPNSRITIGGYSDKHRIVRQTASKDLINLVEIGILEKFKDGKNYFFKLKNKSEIENLILQN